MKRIIVDDREFINECHGRVNINFSTALNNINYRKEQQEGIKNLEKLKEVFNLKDVYYINQTHSDEVIDASSINPKGDIDGDAIVFKGEDIAIGIFTADCVPVIVYDAEKGVIAAIHSGWKGTYNEITKKTCEHMKNIYKCDNLNVIIGPHIRSCCYEVSEELVEMFKNKFGNEINKNRYLDLEQCVIEQVKGIVKSENITSLGICTYCNEDLELHSYRMSKEEAGRLFSFVFIK